MSKENFVLNEKKIETLEEKIVEVLDVNCDPMNYGEVCFALVNVLVRVKGGD